MINLKDTFYRHFQDDNYKSSGDHFAPSYLNSCKRQIFYKKTNTAESNPVDLPAKLKMYFGSMQHTEMQKILEEKGLIEESEIRKEITYNNLDFVYYVDAVLKDGTILEIKTTYGAGMRFIEDMPKDDHIIQTLAYMIFEEKKAGIILYIGRDNGFIIQHNLEIIDNDLFINGTCTNYMNTFNEKILSLQELKNYINDGKIPGRDYSISLKNNNGVITDNFTKDKVKYKSDWQCSYCNYKDKCWKSELEEITDYDFFIDGNFITK